MGDTPRKCTRLREVVSYCNETAKKYIPYNTVTITVKTVFCVTVRSILRRNECDYINTLRKVNITLHLFKPILICSLCPNTKLNRNQFIIFGDNIWGLTEGLDSVITYYPIPFV
jgi:hypothetical protein